MTLAQLKRGWATRNRREPPNVLQRHAELIRTQGGDLETEQAGAKWIWPLLPEGLRNLAKRAVLDDPEADHLLEFLCERLRAGWSEFEQARTPRRKTGRKTR